MIREMWELGEFTEFEYPEKTNCGIGVYEFRWVPWWLVV